MRERRQRVDPAVDGRVASTRGSRSDQSGDSWLIYSQELSAKHRVGWSRGQRVAEKMVPKVGTGREVAGRWEAGRRGPGALLSELC